MLSLLPGEERDDETDVPFNAKGKLGKAVAAYSVGISAYSWGKKAYDWYRLRQQLTITVSSKDPLYNTVLEWLHSEAFGGNSKTVSLVSAHQYDELLENYVPSKVSVIHDATQAQKIMIGEHRVTVTTSVPASEQLAGSKSVEIPRITFTMHSEEAHTLLIDKLLGMYEDYNKTLRPPKLYTPSGWGGFASNNSMPPRSLDSVILKDGELDFLIEDLSTFLESESKYTRLGVPWHRGYLFYGCVGTGKTSIAKALAAHFGLDVFCIPLGDLDKDVELSKLLSDIRPRSILLLEDIDVFSSATKREAENKEVSLSGLLNSLDGVATPHGMISILTTNEIDRLDPALIRAGRIDVRQEFTALDQNQGVRLYEHFYGDTPPRTVNFAGRAPSDVVGIFKQHLDDPKAARKALK